MITVFGGTGFIGRRVVQTLIDQGASVRVVSRRVDSTQVPRGVSCVATNIKDESAVQRAVENSRGVVNVVSQWVEKKGASFNDIHVRGAERIARCAHNAGVDSLVHISGIGVSRQSPSPFIRARKIGEEVVLAAEPNARIVRPSVVYGPNDAFLSGLKMATLGPIVPLFGDGQSRLQPVYVDDVAEAIAALLDTTRRHPGGIYELGGPSTYTYRQLVELVCNYLERRRLLMPLPFGLWRALSRLMAVLPNPPLTYDQIVLLQSDNVASGNMPGFQDLGLDPAKLEGLLYTCLH